jgi:hypothetical protein
VKELLEAAGIAEEKNLPLFSHLRQKDRHVTRRGLYRQDVLRMIKRRYGYPLNFNQASVPVLQLTTYLPKLTLSNFGIAKHMDAIFNSKQSKTPPPF